MGIEIEAKVAVEDLADIADRLRSLAAKLVHSVIQRDTFFSDQELKLVHSGCGLRIRRELGAGSAELSILTFKGPKEPGPYKIRSESEVQIGDFRVMEQILNGLGYQRLLVIEKKRQIWKLDGCEVCLDDVAVLGTFVEVEGPDIETVKRVIQKLGLGQKEHINRGYAKLVRKKLLEQGAEKMEAIFDDKP